MKKKLFAILTGITMLALVGCSSGEEASVESGDSGNTVSQESNEKEDSGEQVEIVVGHFADFRGKNEMATYFEWFEEETGIKAVSEPVTGNFGEVLKTRFAANQEPDVFFMDVSTFVEFADAGLLLPLEENLSTDHIAKFEQNLIDTFSYEGHVYGIPKDYNTLSLFYNKKMFDEAGVEYPTNDWNWNQMLEAGNSIKEYYGYDNDSKYAFVLQNELARFYPTLFTFGADLDREKATVNTDEMVQGLKTFNSLFLDGLATTPADIGRDWDGDTFVNDEAAMTIEGNWMNGFIVNSAPDMEYGVVEIPANNEIESNMLFTVAWSGSSKTEHPEEVAKFIEWITSADMQREFLSDGGGAIPSNNELGNEFVEMYPERQVFLDVVPVAQGFGFGLTGSTLISELGQISENIRLENLETDEEIMDALNNLQNTINSEHERLSK